MNSLSDETLKEYSSRKYGEFPVLAKEIIKLRQTLNEHSKITQEATAASKYYKELLTEAYDIIKNHLPAYDAWIEKAEKIY